MRSLKPLALAATFALLAGLAPAADEARWVGSPFNGKDLAGWKTKPKGKNESRWVVGSAKLDPANPARFAVAKEGAELINAAGAGLDIYTEATYGDCIVTLDVMVPKGSNSGIYLQGNYEIQVLDSFGKEANPGPGDMGGIYGAAAPKNPKYKAPGEWQTFEIHFQAPRFDDKGAKTAPARFIKVILGGVAIQENVEMKGVTGGSLDGKEKARGPLMFQGDHGPVAFRNIKVVPLKG
ncbi:MAG: DUF1080 domain-containing protein [Planctomycetes bacterium]|nr:DUF1080 domain-containing protein [Planctomycetota bacterium]